jgi:hypothetical protein
MLYEFEFCNTVRQLNYSTKQSILKMFLHISLKIVFHANATRPPTLIYT